MVVAGFFIFKEFDFQVLNKKTVKKKGAENSAPDCRVMYC